MSRSPNILLFISDQQRTDPLSCYGKNWIRSPDRAALVAQIRIRKRKIQNTASLPMV